MFISVVFEIVNAASLSPSIATFESFNSRVEPFAVSIPEADWYLKALPVSLILISTPLSEALFSFFSMTPFASPARISIDTFCIFIDEPLSMAAP